MTQTDIVKAEDIQKVQGMISNMETMVNDTAVTNQSELEAITTKIKDIKTLASFIKQEQERYTKPAKEIIAAAKEKYDPYLNACVQAERDLKSKAQTFMLAERERERKEKEKLAKKVETGYMKPETAVARMEKVQEAPKRAQTEEATLSLRMVKAVEIEDQTKIPDEYYRPRELDMVKIRKVALAGVEIPGVKVIEKPSTAIR